MDRREFAAFLPALLAATTLLTKTANAQQTGDMDHPMMGTPTPGPPNGDKPRAPSHCPP